MMMFAQAAQAVDPIPEWLKFGGQLGAVLLVGYAFLRYAQQREKDEREDRNKRDAAALAERESRDKLHSDSLKGIGEKLEKAIGDLSDKFSAENAETRAETRRVVDDYGGLTKEVVAAIVEAKGAIVEVKGAVHEQAEGMRTQNGAIGALAGRFDGFTGEVKQLSVEVKQLGVEVKQLGVVVEGHDRWIGERDPSRGPRGDMGPRGDRGDRGEAGPRGPTNSG